MIVTKMITRMTIVIRKIRIMIFKKEIKIMNDDMNDESNWTNKRNNAKKHNNNNNNNHNNINNKMKK